MILSNLQLVYEENKDKRPFYVRSLLKEIVQFYVLNFVYNSSWGKNLVFKGGTALRFCFDLPRLSEDLDFDIENMDTFDMSLFVKDLSDYFIKKIKFDKFSIKVAKNQRTIYLKLPILKEIGLPISRSDSNILHLRLDFAPVAKNIVYKTDVSTKSTHNLSFLVRHFQLPELFTGKLSAILTREKMEGTKLVERFKGRDYYDMIWFLEKKVSPNWENIKKITNLNKKEALVLLTKKIKKMSKSELKTDLDPFFEDVGYIESFTENFHNLAKKYVSNLCFMSLYIFGILHAYHINS